MNYVPVLNTAVCDDCGREYYAEDGSLIHPGLDVWCAKKRIAEENAALAIERSSDFQACSREWFLLRHVLPTRETLTDRVIANVLARIPAALARAKQLTERRHDEPLFSAERDTRPKESA